MESPPVRRGCLPLAIGSGSHPGPAAADGAVLGIKPKTGPHVGTLSRWTTYDASFAALPHEQRLSTLKSGSDFRNRDSTASNSAPGIGVVGGKYWRFDRGADAVSAEGGSQKSSAEADPEHPLHNGNDLVIPINGSSSNSNLSGIRFPKLNELKHFHYERVAFRSSKVFLDPVDTESVALFGDGDDRHVMFKVEVYSKERWWFVFRDYNDFCALDQLCHKCIYNRVDSQLEALQAESIENMETMRQMNLQLRLSQYLNHLLQLGLNRINCASIMEWFEIDKDGRRLHVASRSGINLRGKAAGRVIRSFESSEPDELPLAIGTIISIIDMPSDEVSTFWRGKKGLKVGFFPKECVEVIEKGSSPPLKHKGSRRGSSAGLASKTNKPPLPTTTKDSRSERVFGGDLGAHLFLTTHAAGGMIEASPGMIPLAVQKCTAFVEKHGIVEGIYRLNGIKRNVDSLREGFENVALDGCPDLEVEGILSDQHCVSSLCKLYFRDLPNPLLTYDLFEEFCNAVTYPDPDDCYVALARCLAKLPPPHLRTTEHLMRHLNRLARQSNVTEMHARNLSIVWAPNLLKIRDETSSPVNFMLIRRTTQVIEWLIERVGWFFGEDGLEAMEGPKPDRSLIPTRPSVEVAKPEAEEPSDVPATKPDVPMLLSPVPAESRPLTSSQSVSNISDTSDRQSIRRSLSDCSRASPVSVEPSRVTVVSNPRKKMSRGSLKTKNSSSSDISRTGSVRSSGRFRFLPFRKNKKVPMEISLPTNIVTTVDVRLHPRVSALPIGPLGASGLITPRETSRMLHDATPGSTHSPASGSGFGTLPYEMDSGADSSKVISDGDDRADEAAYAHADTSSGESDHDTETPAGTTAVKTASDEKSRSGSSVTKRHSAFFSPSVGSENNSASPTTPTRPNFQRVGSEMMSLGHPGVNVRYSQHILHWSFQDGETKAFHLSGAPAEAAPDSARSMGRRRNFGSSSCMDGGGGAAAMTFPAASRQSSGTSVVRQTRAEIEAAAVAASLPKSVTDDSAGTLDDTGQARQQPSPAHSSDMLTCVLRAGDSYVSPTHTLERGAASINGNVAQDMTSSTLLELEGESPQQASTPVPTVVPDRNEASSTPSDGKPASVASSDARQRATPSSSSSSSSQAPSTASNPGGEDLPLDRDDLTAHRTSQAAPTESVADQDHQDSRNTPTPCVVIEISLPSPSEPTEGTQGSPAVSPIVSRSSSHSSIGPQSVCEQSADSRASAVSDSTSAMPVVDGVSDTVEPIDATPLLDDRSVAESIGSSGSSGSSDSDSSNSSDEDSYSCSSSSSSTSSSADHAQPYMKVASPDSAAQLILPPSASTDDFDSVPTSPGVHCEHHLVGTAEPADDVAMLRGDDPSPQAVDPVDRREADSPFDPRAEEAGRHSSASSHHSQSTAHPVVESDHDVPLPAIVEPDGVQSTNGMVPTATLLSFSDTENEEPSDDHFPGPLLAAESHVAPMDLLGDLSGTDGLPPAMDLPPALVPVDTNTPATHDQLLNASGDADVVQEPSRAMSSPGPSPAAFGNLFALQEAHAEDVDGLFEASPSARQRCRQSSSSSSTVAAAGHTAALQSFNGSSCSSPGTYRSLSTSDSISSAVDAKTSASVQGPLAIAPSPDISEEDSEL